MNKDEMAFEIFKILIQKNEIKTEEIADSDMLSLSSSYAYDAYILCEGFLFEYQERYRISLEKLLEEQRESENNNKIK